MNIIDLRCLRLASETEEPTAGHLAGGAQKIERIMGPLSEEMNQALQDFTEDELKAVLRFFDVTAGAVSRHLGRIHEDMPSKRGRSSGA